MLDTSCHSNCGGMLQLSCGNGSDGWPAEPSAWTQTDSSMYFEMSNSYRRLQLGHMILMFNPPLHSSGIWSIFLFMRREMLSAWFSPSNVFCWQLAIRQRNFWGLFSLVELAVLAGSNFLLSASGNGEVESEAPSRLCLSLSKSDSSFELQGHSFKMVDEFTSFPSRRKLSFFASFLFFWHQRLFVFFNRGAFVFRPVLCRCTSWWQSLRFLKLMQNAQGAYCVLDVCLCDQNQRWCFTVAQYYILQSAEKIK